MFPLHIVSVWTTNVWFPSFTRFSSFSLHRKKQAHFVLSSRTAITIQSSHHCGVIMVPTKFGMKCLLRFVHCLLVFGALANAQFNVQHSGINERLNQHGCELVGKKKVCTVSQAMQANGNNFNGLVVAFARVCYVGPPCAIDFPTHRNTVRKYASCADIERFPRLFG